MNIITRVSQQKACQGKIFTYDFLNLGTMLIIFK
jgi:hypothetical protein